ncbi:thiamine phosphate synthase [Methylicorpusculum sp.]|uniref:thiamine phosphate synthase n=1 Tax=Methylicorpusculum sp. TaxID=2713644 RepID=UPI0027288470|nr:thiamine phosphate synthase [Methylicorpusculum sp.]MDO8842811.1 thiamine phosphate synthase [Methylicorpusculum sp.]MDP2179885.1 thiamine phosphate synthase [Methylicorpusculum sp.]MDP3527692.1 thiamine phosphate synthase [Methylicorpusculum sp.]MDZ4154268.1 thiamine phosphate synthase [Methylicorpusculum sp.]
MKLPSKGLYAITQTEHKSAETVIQEVAAAIRGGAVIVQYRDKQPTDALALGHALLALCRSHKVPMIINDSIDLAAQLDADGVHLGREDGLIAKARERLGDTAIIGVSCYNDLARAKAAEQEGANYVAFGRFFPSNSKPLAAPAELATLRLAKQQLALPIVAIGGILPENGRQLVAAGADFLAVIGGLFDHEPEQAARTYQALFE